MITVKQLKDALDTFINDGGDPSTGVIITDDVDLNSRDTQVDPITRTMIGETSLRVFDYDIEEYVDLPKSRYFILY